MKRLVFFMFLIPLFCFTGKLYAQDRIVAVVNNEIITQSEIDNFARFMYMQLSSKYESEELQEQFNNNLPDILNRLIEDKLILQEAKKEKVSIDESRLKARIGQMKSGYPSERAFMDDLISNGLTLGDVETKLRNQMLMFEIVDTKIRSKITINPQEVTDFYLEHKDELNEPAQRNVIAIIADERAKIGQALGELKKGREFNQVAESLGLEVSELGSVSPGQLKKEIDQAISLLRVGEISEIVELGESYYIFKLQDITPPREYTLEEAQQKIYNFLVEQKMQSQVTAWLDELKLKSYIDIKS